MQLAVAEIGPGSCAGTHHGCLKQQGRPACLGAGPARAAGTSSAHSLFTHHLSPCLLLAAAAAAGDGPLRAFARNEDLVNQPAFVIAVALSAGVLRHQLTLDGLLSPKLGPGSITYKILPIKRREAGEQ